MFFLLFRALLLFPVSSTDAFVEPSFIQARPGPPAQLLLSSSASRSRQFQSTQEDGGIDEMRRLLEKSWNVETMGSVPTNADNAAENAVNAIQSALDRGNMTPLFNVDVLLPQYDIRQGPNLYDEVLAVEFCIGLANRLKGKSAIIVRDDKTIQTVSRILDARGRTSNQQIIGSKGTATVTDEDEDDDENDDDDDDDDVYDDFADFGLIGGDNDADARETTNASFRSRDSIESFREQLIADWDTMDDEVEKTEEAAALAAATPLQETTPSVPRRFRLASMLGSAEISSGADMTDDVIRAVSDNGKPHDDEDTIIILSAVSREEMIGVRGLVGKYEGKKNIILVNCSLNPIPRELIMAQTVYSIQPFIARTKVSETNLFGSQTPAPPQNNKEALSPKVVVMRRFPRDWEIFVDLGDGFELASSVPPEKVDKKGPSMQFISGCVKQHMQSKLG